MKSNINIDPRLLSRESSAKEVIELVRERKCENGSLIVDFISAVDDVGCFMGICKAIVPNTSIRSLTFNFCQRRGQDDPGSYVELGMTFILKNNDITAITLNDFDIRYPIYHMMAALKENKSVTSFQLPRLSNTSVNTQVSELMRLRSFSQPSFFKKPDEKKSIDVHAASTNTQNVNKSDADIQNEAENIIHSLLNN